MSNLVQKFNEYSEWRTALTQSLEQFRTWVQNSELSDAVIDQRIVRIRDRLSDDKLSIAFVAEFSRGKSELINALFFADYGQRILPSAAGRTTMCPTELMYDDTIPPCIRLLPIETRAEAQTTSDYRGQSQVWTVLPLDIQSGEGMLEAFRQVSLTKKVSADVARTYGLLNDDDPDSVIEIDEDGMVEISQWRYAIVNFPHPLLRQGLIIIDTPGLNAIGTEPELTLNLIPNAHAVMFILAADTGVTRSDIEVWRDHIGAGAGRMVVLNKIDSMWDELRSDEEIEQQIKSQVTSVAHTLNLQEAQVFPVSAQKGLVAKINKDAPLLARSRLIRLEHALSQDLIPSKQEIIRSQVNQELSEVNDSLSALLTSRERGVVEELQNLNRLRNKNSAVIEYMLRHIDEERKEFDQSLGTFQSTRAVFLKLSTEVFSTLGMEILKEEILQTRDSMKNSRFSVGLHESVSDFFARMKLNLQRSNQKTDEILSMMTVMYRKFATEHGLALSAPMAFSLEKYMQDIENIEIIFNRQFNSTTMLTTPKYVLMQKFFESIASRVKQSFSLANRDVEAWLKVVMAPIEAQIKERKSEIKKRMNNIQRIHSSSESLEETIADLISVQLQLESQREALRDVHENVLSILNVKTNFDHATSMRISQGN